MRLLRATLYSEITTSYWAQSWFSAGRVGVFRQQEEAANLIITPTPRHARVEMLVAGIESSLPHQALTAPHCDAREGEHSPGAAPPCP